MLLKLNGMLIPLSNNLKLNKFRKDNLNYTTVNVNHHENIGIIKQSPVQLIDNGITENYYLIDGKRTTVSFNPLKYNYELNLIEPTLYLKNIVLPNRALTQRQSNPKKLIEVLENYLEIYAPDLKLHSSLINELIGFKASEGVWQTPTLYSLFNDLIGAHVNAFVQMDDYVNIKLVLLDDIGEEITNYNKVERVSDYENYTNKINYNIKNARGSSSFGFRETLNFVTQDGPMFMDDNFIVETSHKIDEIINMQIRVAIKKAFGGYSYKTFNVTSHVVRKEVYDTYKPSTRTNLITESGFRRNAVHYSKGDNKIMGWNYNDKDWIPIITLDQPAWKNIFRNYTQLLAGQSYDFKRSSIILFYKPMVTDVNVNLIKNVAPGNKTVISGQDEQSVDIKLFGKQQRNILNSLGEDDVFIYGTGNPPQLMDYLGNNYVSELQINKLSSGDNWVAIAQANYGELNLKTTLKSERRYTERAGLVETIITNHITEFNYEFVDNRVSNINANTLYSYMLEDVMFKLNNNLGPSNDYFAHITLNNGLNKSYVKDVLAFSFDNSRVLTFTALDNYSMALGFEVEDDNVGAQKEARYVDNNGEFSYMNVNLYRGRYLRRRLTDDYERLASKALPVVLNNSFIGDTNNTNMGYFNVARYKDDREITAETIQFNFLNNDQFVLHDEFFNLSDMHLYGTDSELEVYINYSNPHYKYNLHGRKYGDYEPDVSVIFGNNYIELDTVNVLPEFYGWTVFNALTDKPLFSYNGKQTRLNAIIANTKPDEIGLIEDYYNVYIDDTAYYKITKGTNEVGLNITVDITDVMNYSVSGSVNVGTSYNVNINDITRYNVTTSMLTQKRYAVNIEDNTRYKIIKSLDEGINYNININDSVLYIINAKAIAQKRYTLNIEDNDFYKINVSSAVQKRYSFDISDEVLYTIYTDTSFVGLPVAAPTITAVYKSGNNLVVRLVNNDIRHAYIYYNINGGSYKRSPLMLSQGSQVNLASELFDNNYDVNAYAQVGDLVSPIVNKSGTV